MLFCGLRVVLCACTCAVPNQVPGSSYRVTLLPPVSVKEAAAARDALLDSEQVRPGSRV